MSENDMLEAQTLEDVNDSIAFSTINDLMLLKRVRYYYSLANKNKNKNTN